MMNALKGKLMKVPSVAAQDALDGRTIEIDGKEFMVMATGHCELVILPLKKKK